MKRLVLAAVVLGLGLPAAQGGEKTIGMAVEFVDHAACAYIAKSKGWFEAEGVRVRSYQTYVTGMALAAALARGDIDVAYICLIPAISTIANARVRFKVVAGTHRYGYGLLADPKKVGTVKDLENPDIRIACPMPGSPNDVLLHKMVEKYGLDQGRILRKLRRMPPHMVLLTLQMGQIDAGWTCEQFPTMGEKLGFKVLLTAQDLWPDMQGSVVIAREELIRDHPDIAAKIVHITERATRYIHEHPQDAARIVAESLQADATEVLKADKADTIAARLRITPDVILKSLTARMECTTDVDPKQVQATIDYLAKLGYIKKSFKAEDILHLEFLKK